MEKFKQAWIVSGLSPEEVEIIKQTDIITTVKFIRTGTKTRINTGLVHETKEECLMECLRENYRCLSIYATTCADILGKIKIQETILKNGKI